MKLTQRYILISVFSLLACFTLTYVVLLHNTITQLSTENKTITNRGSSQHGGLIDSAIKTRQITMTADEFRKNPGMKTGNPLIDDYGKNDMTLKGENGSKVVFPKDKMADVKASLARHRLNVLASDAIPLNRIVPDSRFKRCPNITYDHDLPTASVIIPFYNEWPSILLRTVYSIINRTPRHLLWEILLIDDSSDLEGLKESLDTYVASHYPRGLVKIIRMPERVGLIKARQHGWKISTGDVIVIFDSHMEVNKDWLQPLLTLIKSDRKTIALGTLDYIKAETLEYTWNHNYLTRYGFDWRMLFYETYFRPDNVGPDLETPKRGVVMVGTGYAVDKKYFGEIGGFDDGMKVWGGENIELAWRTWMCGGQLMHAPCSKIGHIARSQPYQFPGGRRKTEVTNYKRAVEVWMEPEHKKFVYDFFPDMKEVDAGDLSDRLALKKKLKCKNFTWFLDNIWPELLVYDRNVFAWGSARNPSSNRCLDNHQHLFQAPNPLFADLCHYHFATQGFSWITDRTLRTSLHCVVLKSYRLKERPQIQGCLAGSRDVWIHLKNGFLKHEISGLCMDLDEVGPFMNTCQIDSPSQMWTFNKYNI
ncbi:inactive polypeptide N-acetylgalactosaminyltransferase-like protein 5 [Gigantopelta aegis]|uniref:inactive polypeptide N-acetylgalactosaminyltransferase-like protein 5 n=1 Tax=Gigantopelta aegis TaxID=1735272 RepID=UPI001B88A8D4|nr:inactive polypeptide N-acetylgalactosaminyltransferase-like protein 5 [Gigantopelta aegis]